MDSLAQAQTFTASAGGPPNMLWSDSYEAWNHYNAGNPNLVLLDGAGVTQIGRSSRFNQSRIEDLLAELA